MQNDLHVPPLHQSNESGVAYGQRYLSREGAGSTKEEGYTALHVRKGYERTGLGITAQVLLGMNMWESGAGTKVLWPK
jgi:hypothetical protein